jgi:hypothetical protein
MTASSGLKACLQLLERIILSEKDTSRGSKILQPYGRLSVWANQYGENGKELDTILNMRLAKCTIKETILEEIVDIMVAIIHGWCDIKDCKYFWGHGQTTSLSVYHYRHKYWSWKTFFLDFTNTLDANIDTESSPSIKEAYNQVLQEMEVFEFRKVTYMERINSKSLDDTMRKVEQCLDRLYYLSPALDELMAQAEAADRPDRSDVSQVCLVRPISQEPMPYQNLKSEPLANTEVVDGRIVHNTLMTEIDEILKTTIAIRSENIALHVGKLRY